MKAKILETAYRLFCGFGIKSISMDAVAREMGVSKKTLYQWFRNKDKLVEAALDKFLEQVRTEPEAKDLNSVEMLVKTLRLHNQKVAKINVSFFYDLEKYHSKASQKLDKYLTLELRPFLVQNLKTGIAQGLYRPDLDPEITARFCIAGFTVVVDQELFPGQKFSQTAVRRQVFKLFLRGIVSPEGQSFLTEERADRVEEIQENRN